MAIEYFMILTIDEYKQSKLYNVNDEQYNFMSDYNINECIIMASTQINEISKYQVEENWNQFTDKQRNDLKIACERQVNFLIRNGTEYLKLNNLSLSSGGFSQSISQNNELAISPEVFMILNKLSLLASAEFKDYNNEPILNRNKKIIFNTTDYDNEFITRAEAYKRLLPYNQTLFKSDNNTIIVNMDWDISTEQFKVNIQADINRIESLVLDKVLNDDTFMSKIINNTKQDKEIQQTIQDTLYLEIEE